MTTKNTAMDEIRIVSFLPAATEMIWALGLADQLVGITHECDYPAEARERPVVVRSVLPLEEMALAEIDLAVRERIRYGLSLYAVDENLLRQLAPTHIVTQALCHVCAPSGVEITQAMRGLPDEPQVLWFKPQSLADIGGDICRLGNATGRAADAEKLIASNQSRLENIRARVSHASHRPRVFCLEWTDPYYCSGHWIPEMVEIAGGFDALGRKHGGSALIDWKQIEHWAPEILVVMPCGFGVEGSAEQMLNLLKRPEWRGLPAVRNRRVYAVDGNSYFARPGPRVIDGTELLAHLFHPELCEWNRSGNGFVKMA